MNDSASESASANEVTAMAVAAESTGPPSTRTAHVRFSVAVKARGKRYRPRRIGSACESAYLGIERARRASDRSARRASQSVRTLSSQSGLKERHRKRKKYARHVRSSDPFRFLTLSRRASIRTSPESARPHECFRSVSRASPSPDTNVERKGLPT